MKQTPEGQNPEQAAMLQNHQPALTGSAHLRTRRKCIGPRRHDIVAA
jgi:hypothetical protein